MRTGNPALQGDLVPSTRSFDPLQEMSIEGTTNKSFILLALAALSAWWIWSNPTLMSLFLVGMIGGFIVALITIFKKNWAPVTAPLYAVLEGFALGGLSVYMELEYPGIVLQAISLTFGTLFVMLAAYRTGIIKVTEKFRLAVFIATGGIALVYITDLILSLFGIKVSFIYQNGAIGILFSLFVVAIAALNLILDFDVIETLSASGVPKYMEWYGAFSLMVTLVWLYLEIIRLLSKLRNR
ncbi:MAG: hypothetical protein A2X42_00865 [Candidatus Margulisbacteria bacterium GWF2_38_17]|nr:MAG: hypothetical protein A2X43_09025 [Candidatus Margulisbacteria bacterium GWD2_39_127]OGI03635.1 MAG: hypothetical protein A2X42_00865 [Candidatus Margulisbacteria bacterium GWF2_38_17]OGI11141.1 MAG: hypothetical protein A2X41_02160 [Candidatus Margulisbacteria bacterium GWE2_39_32]